MDEEFEAGLEVAHSEVGIAPGFVVQEDSGLSVEDLELELLGMASVESRTAPDLNRIRRLIQDGAVARGIRPYCIQQNMTI